MRSGVHLLVDCAFIAALATGCTPAEPGNVNLCFASTYDGPTYEGAQATHVIAERVLNSDLTDAPPAFQSCALDISRWAELIDDAGDHVWVGASARLGSSEAIPESVFDDVAGAHLAVSITYAFHQYGDLSLVRDNVPLLVLQRFGDVTTVETGAVQVAPAGPTSLPTPGPCGTTTPHGITFDDDDGSHTVTVGDIELLNVGTSRLRAANVNSVDYGSNSSCEDALTGLYFSWMIAVIPSDGQTE